MIRTAISPRLAIRTLREHRGQPDRTANRRSPNSTGCAFSRKTLTIGAGDVALDLVHQLHRLDDAEHLALRDDVADLDVRIGVRVRRPGRRCRRSARSRSGRRPRRRPPAAAASGRRRPAPQPPPAARGHCGHRGGVRRRGRRDRAAPRRCGSWSRHARSRGWPPGRADQSDQLTDLVELEHACASPQTNSEYSRSPARRLRNRPCRPARSRSSTRTRK